MQSPITKKLFITIFALIFTTATSQCSITEPKYLSSPRLDLLWFENQFKQQKRESQIPLLFTLAADAVLYYHHFERVQSKIPVDLHPFFKQLIKKQENFFIALFDRENSIKHFKEFKSYKSVINSIRVNNISLLWGTITDSTERDKIPWFIEHGANVNDINADGENPLHMAKIASFNGYLPLFITAGTNINHQDNEGNTPLHVAALFHNEDAVQILLANGANTKLKNKKQKSAADLIKQMRKNKN